MLEDLPSYDYYSESCRRLPACLSLSISSSIGMLHHCLRRFTIEGIHAEEISHDRHSPAQWSRCVHRTRSRSDPGRPSSAPPEELRDHMALSFPLDHPYVHQRCRRSSSRRAAMLGHARPRLPVPSRECSRRTPGASLPMAIPDRSMRHGNARPVHRAARRMAR